MTPRPLERFQRAMLGAGTIYGPVLYPSRRGGNTQPACRWQTAKLADAVLFWNIIWVHLCPPKQEQFLRVWEEVVADRKARNLEAPDLRSGD